MKALTNFPFNSLGSVSKSVVREVMAVTRHLACSDVGLRIALCRVRLGGGVGRESFILR